MTCLTDSFSKKKKIYATTWTPSILKPCEPSFLRIKNLKKTENKSKELKSTNIKKKLKKVWRKVNRYHFSRKTMKKRGKTKFCLLVLRKRPNMIRLKVNLRSKETYKSSKISLPDNWRLQMCSRIKITASWPPTKRKK